MSKWRVMLNALAPTLVLWVILLSFGFWHQDTQWPEARGEWEQFVTICILIEFFILKALLLGRRMFAWDWLTVSLILVNASLALIFLIQQSFALWPNFFTVDHPALGDWIIRIMLYELIACLLFSIWQLVSIIPAEDAQRL